jgi:CheY-like chemotaxis protein
VFAVTALLESWNAKVVSAESGEHALAQWPDIDLVLMES